jgi:uncharacterized protein
VRLERSPCRARVRVEAPAAEALIPALAVAAGAFAHAVTGLGFSLVAAPFLVVALGQRDGVPTAMLLSLALNIVVLVRERNEVLLRESSWLLVPAVLVTPPLAWLSHRVDADGLAVAAGVITIVAALLLASGFRWARAEGRPWAVGAGVASAAMNVVASISGPAVALYALNARWRPAALRGTLQVYFLALNLAGLASLGLPPAPVLPAVGLVIGFVLGTLVTGRVPEQAARFAVLSLATAGGFVAIWHGVSS